MTEAEIPEPNENMLRREVERLSRQLHDPLLGDDPQQAQALAAQLNEALAKLEALEQARQAETPDRGVIASKRGKAGTEMSADVTGIDISVTLGMTHVPTGIIHLLEPSTHPLVRFQIRYTRGRERYVRLRVTSRVEGYSAQAVDTVELERGKESPDALTQLPSFFPQRLAGVKELTRANLLVRVDYLDGSGMVELAKSYPIWLMPPTTALLSIPDPVEAGKKIDFSPYLAAWVTPNDPYVQQLISEAAQIHPNRRFIGYQGDDLDVESEVRAVYNAIQGRGMRYVNSVIVYGTGNAEVAQRVRLPRESLQTCSANCLDGTVLMASALEHISLNAAIVLVPLHAFLGWQNWSGSWEYVETTMVATHSFEEAHSKANATAARFSAADNLDHFRRHQLPNLRTKMGISPMPILP